MTTPETATANKTSESCYQLAEICREDSKCDITPSLYADFPVIAKKYQMMEKALDRADIQLSLMIQIFPQHSALFDDLLFIKEALSYDPLKP